ncbi:hypothetical protein AAT19DRAFT_15593 [Rhodotorula toruloides]|uniref:Uncharacterized protein n=1 Tax=Rhodotorula toruloides TaxID=5286 RepID=A0A2T0A7Z0_RHOTO|nr:hypothetical protein AAT19DRAFT_15593 [Rhodotorula toruloides]
MRPRPALPGHVRRQPHDLARALVRGNALDGRRLRQPPRCQEHRPALPDAAQRFEPSLPLQRADRVGDHRSSASLPSGQDPRRRRPVHRPRARKASWPNRALLHSHLQHSEHRVDRAIFAQVDAPRLGGGGQTRWKLLDRVNSLLLLRHRL